MIRALLDNRKSQTRRTAKAIPSDAALATADDWNGARADIRMRPFEEWGHKRGYTVVRDADGSIAAYPCPYGVPGDLLWVRETHAIVGNVDPGWVLYRASGYENECRRHGFDGPPPESETTWKPSIHMPRWASRITLRITDVRVQRLRDISEQDAMAEGVVKRGKWFAIDDKGTFDAHTPRLAYSCLWASINGADSWEANPFVWCLTFEVIRANVDEVIRSKAA